MELPGGILAFIEGFAPTGKQPVPKGLGDVRAVSEESKALAKDLKRHGIKFVGPTTAYALMQATGLVNDHVADCWCR